MDRHIDFEAIENFRDFGGYETTCGRRVVSGRLYRSGHHAFATDADLARLQALGVGAIADLRQPSERTRESGRRWRGFGAQAIADYLLTNDESRIARKMAHLAAFVETVAGRRPSDEAMRTAVSAFPEFLDAFFGSIREIHGSVDAYLEVVLGVDGALLARIRERILDSG